MGCDIHWVIERRFGNLWIGYLHDCGDLLPTYENQHKSASIHELGARNYRFFASLAGVRGDGPEPNGLPEDISQLTAAMVSDWDGDGHSHSHLPLREFIMRYILSNEENIPKATSMKLRGADPVEHWLAGRVYKPDSLDDYRVIFWFDN